MKLQVLQLALECLQNDVKEGWYGHRDDFTADDVKQALQQVAEMANQLQDKEDRNIWQDDIVVLHSAFVSEWANRLWYNVYGKKARQNNNSCTFEQFKTAVIKEEEWMYGEYLTDSFLLDGYSFIDDLWHSNEATGDHNPDGTFSD